MGDINFSLIELSNSTGVDSRTIRHYISIGLLPSPFSRGRSAKYGQIHLDRLRAIKVLQTRSDSNGKPMKLEEIGNYLSNCGPNEIDELLKDWKLEEPQSAREFLEKIAPEFQKISKSRPSHYRTMQSQSLVQSAPLMDQASTQNQSRDAPIDRLIQHLNQVSRRPPRRSRRRENRQVIEIVPGVELHVRGQDHTQLNKYERVCDYIRHILTEGDYE